MVRYIFAEEFVTIKGAKDAKAQVIGDALAEIAAQHGGRLKPQFVPAAARNPRHPLHRHFTWDDKAAADERRLDQARELIRCVKVRDSAGRDGTVRAWVSVNDGQTSYRSMGEIKSSADLQAIVLAAAARDLKTFEDRYKELQDVCTLVRKARTVVERRRSTVEHRATA